MKMVNLTPESHLILVEKHEQIMAQQAIIRRLVAALELVGSVNNRGLYNTRGQVLIHYDQIKEIGDAINEAKSLIK